MNDLKLVPVPQVPVSAWSREDCAKDIRRAHAEAIAGLSHFVIKAIEAGSRLEEAKKAIAHGDFGDFVTLECGLKPSTARLYMKLARGKDKLTQGVAANQQRSSVLTQAQALKLLGSKARPKPKPKKRFWFW
jgi:hypothetical protein